VMDFEHFGEAGELVGDTSLPRSIGRANRDEREEALVEGARIDLRNVAGDDPFGFELTEALEHRGRGKAYRPGNFNLRKPRVFLKKTNNLEIGGVEHGDVRSPSQHILR
jgi:hypothetical protein